MNPSQVIFPINTTDTPIAMQEKYNQMPKTFRFLRMNALDMDFRDEMFSHAREKGPLDAILSGDRSTENARKYLNEVYRVLQPGGVFMCVSYRNIEHRLRHLQNFEWNISVHRVYKKDFDDEFFKIRAEFVSPGVLKDLMEMKLDDEERVEPDPEADKFKKPTVTPKEHYVYVCSKPAAQAPSDHEANPSGMDFRAGDNISMMSKPGMGGFSQLGQN
jgi:SAM-dependent methyltransferase